MADPDSTSVSCAFPVRDFIDVVEDAAADSCGAKMEGRSLVDAGSLLNGLDDACDAVASFEASLDVAGACWPADWNRLVLVFSGWNV